MPSGARLRYLLTYSLSRKSWNSSSPALTGEPPNWGIRTRSPTATPMGSRLPFLSMAPGPTARTLASLSFSTLDSGRKMPLAVLVSALMRWTRTRSRRGARARMDLMEVAYSATMLVPAISSCSHAPHASIPSTFASPGFLIAEDK